MGSTDLIAESAAETAATVELASSAEGTENSPPAAESEDARRRVLQSAVFRFALALLITIWIAIDTPQLTGLLWAMVGYTAWTALALLLVRVRALNSYEITLVVDVIAVTATIYAFGARSTPLAMFYVPLVVMVTLHGGRRLAQLCLVCALASLAVVLGLEYLGLIPSAPLADLLAQHRGTGTGGLFTFLLTALALGSAYYLIVSNLNRLGGQVQSMDRLRADAVKQRKHTETLQGKLEEVQRLESLGRLAGGVAHDFNNLLTGILGYARLMKEDLDDQAPMQADVDEVIRAAGRASELTGQLLAFSRRQIIQVRLVDLNRLLDELQRMLERIIGENIDINYCPGPSPALVKADSSQLEQIVINLAVNARDAMPQGGQLTIETGPVVLDQGYCKEHPDVQPGLYLLLAISDSGSGMDEETRRRAFEPFFTTKEVGQGTGLGLATAYGIVKQHRGHIEIHSEPEQGTTFRIYFPMAEGEISEADLFVEHTPTGLETVLLAEDEPVVRNLVARILGQFGYTVLEAESGEAALDLATEHCEAIDLLLTDVVMPGMSGPELVRRMHENCPATQVVFMSGYPANELGRLGVLDSGIEFMVKPFSAEELLTKVRRVLDQARDSRTQ